MKKRTLVTLAAGSALAAAVLTPAQAAAGNPFAATALPAGYQVADAGKQSEAACGASKKQEASCGAAKKDAEMKAAKQKDAACGASKKQEASCGANKK